MEMRIGYTKSGKAPDQGSDFSKEVWLLTLANKVGCVLRGCFRNMKMPTITIFPNIAQSSKMIR